MRRLRARLAPREQPPDPRQQYAPLLREELANLDAAVVDGFFANLGYTMPLTLVHQLVELVRERRPAFAVEVGSGVSTVALNTALAEHSGYLVSIEESDSYAFETFRTLTRPDRVALVCATGGPELAELARGWRPGLVVIDGPSAEPRFTEPWLRLYRFLLAPDCVCAVDDTHRDENDSAAALLADENRLRKHDFVDPVAPGRHYSLLLPAGTEPPSSAAAPVRERATVVEAPLA
jgi:hypothetical protein